VKVHFKKNLNQKQKDEWTEFWQSSRHSHVQQHEKFGEVERAKGRIPVYVYGEKEGKLTGIAIFSIRPLFFGKRYSLEAICARGPVFDDIANVEDFLKQTVSYFKAQNVGNIRIAPYWFQPDSDEIVSVLKKTGFTPYTAAPAIIDRIRNRTVPSQVPTGVVNLNRDEDEMMASFSKSTRREIRRAERQNIEVHPVKNIDEAFLFFKHLKKMCEERGINHPSFSEFKGTYDTIFKEEKLGIILNAYYETTFLGGLWIFKGHADAHTNWYVVVSKPLTELSNLRIGPFLWFKGMLWAKEMGGKFIDMEGSPVEVDESNPSYRVQRFKRGFSPEAPLVLRQHTCKCSTFTQTISEISKLWLTSVRISKQKFFQLTGR